MNDRNELLMIIASLTLVFIGLLLISHNAIEEGEVTEKKYQEAHSSFEMKPSASGMSPQLVHQSESWSVVITNHTDNRLCLVDRAVWDTIDVGDWYKCE